MSENKGRNDANASMRNLSEAFQWKKTKTMQTPAICSCKNYLLLTLASAQKEFSAEQSLVLQAIPPTPFFSLAAWVSCLSLRGQQICSRQFRGGKQPFCPQTVLPLSVMIRFPPSLGILLQILIHSKESSWLVALTSIAIKLEQSNFFWIHMHHTGRMKLGKNHLVILDDQNLLGPCICTGTGHAHLARRFLVAKIGQEKTIPHTRVPAGTLVETLEAVNFFNHGSSEKTSKFFKKSLKCSMEISSFTVAK